MKRLLNYIDNNLLIKVASLNSASVLTRIVAGFLTSKAIAVFIGAEGLALIGNFRNFISAMQSFSTLGFYNGAVKYISELKSNIGQLAKVMSTIFFVSLLASIIVAFSCYFNADYINSIIFPNNQNYVFIVKILAVGLPFYALNVFLISLLNGFSKYKLLVVINIIGQILSVLVTLILIYLKKIEGALIAVALSESLIIFITVICAISQSTLLKYLKLRYVNFIDIKKMSSYSIMALFSALILPFTALAIRSHIIENLGYKEAGFWEAMTSISKYYLMFISSLLTLYILPRFSEINKVSDFRKEVFNFYKTIMPLFGLGLVIIYFLRFYIIEIIFSSEFKPVEGLFLWQLLGDFIKVLSIVIAYQLLAKKMLWYYIITEFFSVSILYGLSIYFINIYGIQGATMAHFLTSIVHFVLILIIFRKSLFSKLEQNKLEHD